ncbi:hypothetical protein GCM10010266_47140 [Streptomyces griseomycini]|nr:hypothetical protein GCM10010266_47140 [Streptomyces griseomycini]
MRPVHLLDDGDTLFTATTGTHPLGTANPPPLDDVLTAGRGRGDPRDRTRCGHRRVGRALIDGAETTKVLNAARAANVDAIHITVISRLEGLPGKADCPWCCRCGGAAAPDGCSA